jgi:[ribosomal protein S5]-alanine N-acetyltransferase
VPLPFTTERLRLRPATLEDLDTWLAISRDAETVWWGEPSSTLEDARANLEKQLANQERYGFSLWAVELEAEREVIGATGLQHLGDGEEIEVGYRFLREHWGRGYATEAARAAIRFGFDELGLDRIVAVTLPTNQASRRVMEKCGMSFVGVAHVYGRTQVKYALSR